MIRRLGSEARVNLRQLARGVAHRDDWFHLVDAAAKLRQLDILIDDSCQVSPLELSAKARLVKHDRAVSLDVPGEYIRFENYATEPKPTGNRSPLRRRAGVRAPYH